MVTMERMGIPERQDPQAPLDQQALQAFLDRLDSRDNLVTLVKLEETALQDQSERRGPLETLVQQGHLDHVVPTEPGGREEYKAPLEMMGGRELMEHADPQAHLVHLARTVFQVFLAE